MRPDFSLDDIDRLPFGVALPLREALRSSRHSPPSNWPTAAYHLIGREVILVSLVD
jgi:anaphase-promoting complex subunit 1